MSETIIRTNGRGNAWPVYLGQPHAFYNQNEPFDLSNTSYSIFNREHVSGKIKNEILIDAGHGSVQFLIKNNNHLPDALILTHPHIDHCLSTDWIAQSYFKFRNQKFPVYASKMCWDRVVQAFPQLENTVVFKELKSGIPQLVEEFKPLELTFFPVFHGESALGAGMIMVKDISKNAKALFTGDVLCPLLRNQDLRELENCDVVYTDTNNRFSYPNSNHWSFTFDKKNEGRNIFFDGWYNQKGRNLVYLIGPNLPVKFDSKIHAYFEEFLNEQIISTSLVFNILDFVKKINPKVVNLVHYSGTEDKKHNNQEIFNEVQLANWANKMATQFELKTKFNVPKVGDEFIWIEKPEI